MSNVRPQDMSRPPWRRTTAIAVVSLSVALPVSAAETTAEYLVMAQVRAARTMVDFCKTAAPELTAQLESAYSTMHARSITELAPVIRRAVEKPMFAQPVPSAVVKANNDLTRAMLAAVDDEDVRQTCAYTLNAIKSRTPNEIRARGEDALRRYEPYYPANPEGR